MPKLDVATVHLPQRTIRVDVEYYDNTERDKLLAYPTADAIRRVVEQGVMVPCEEFLTYYLFHRKRPGKPGWRNYQEIGHRIERSISDLAEWIDFNGQSISTPRDVEIQEKALTERIGESVGLSVINDIHQLTEADWDHIPEQSGARPFRTFDYQIASDGSITLQLEAKGSSCEDNTRKTPSISGHKRSIHEKKIAIAKSGTDYPFPASLRYGTIAIVGEDPAVPVKCLLLDPPAVAEDASARRLRLLNRMRFLADWISFVSPRSHLASALNTRVASLQVLRDPFELDNVPLRRGNNEFFEFEVIDRYGHSSFFSNKAWVSDGPAGGIVTNYNRDLLFLGFREELPRLAAAQNFLDVLSYTADTVSLLKTVQIHLTLGRFQALRLPDTMLPGKPAELLPGAPREPGLLRISLAGELHYTKEGLVFGVLPVQR